MLEGIARGKLSFTLQGKKLRGSFALVKTKYAPNSWLMLKHKDEFVTERNVLEDDASVRSGLTIQDPKGAAAKAIEKYDDTKVADFLRAYKSLNADGFADKDKTPKDLGLEPPTATVLITLNDGAKRELKVGSTAEGTARWVQASGVSDLVSISSWAAEWALAEPKKFQKSDEKKPEDAANPHGGAAPPAGSAKPASSAKPAAPKPAAPKPAAPAPAPAASGG